MKKPFIHTSKNSPLRLLGLLAISAALLSGSAFAEIIYSDNFSGNGTTDLNGTTPDGNPFSPASGPVQWLFQGPPAESKVLAAQKKP